MGTLSHTLKNKDLWLEPKGSWTSDEMSQVLESHCDTLKTLDVDSVHIDMSKAERWDTAGVWLIERTLAAFKRKNIRVQQSGESSSYKAILELIQTSYSPETLEAQLKPHQMPLLERLGHKTVNALNLIVSLIVFLGEVVAKLLYVLPRPRLWRGTSFVAQMEQVGLNAVPIVVAISFSVGVVLAYQGADQLQKFGAAIYTINLVTISVAREVGILLAAIMVAGRSGSAITAQIGIMKLNQEIDALRAMGKDPVVILAIPRILALVATMPLLAFVSDIAGFAGGGVMVILSMDVSPLLYVTRLGEAVTAWSFWIGIIKAPIFGFIIGVIACFEGFQVKNNAESVGKQTTKSVVESIFVVMVADALFSVFFSQLGV